MTEIIPALDLIDGKVVRLLQGDYDKVTRYFDDPVILAKEFENRGYRRLHIVDLHGARDGNISSLKVVERISNESSLTIDFGGGIRESSDIDRVLASGASKVCVGSMAISDSLKIKSKIDELGPEKFIIACDIKNNTVVGWGWKKASGESWTDFITIYVEYDGVEFLCTVVENDGMLEGPALAFYRKVLDRFPDLRLIASGGVSSVEDLKRLESLGIEQVVVGKALYEGRIC